MELPEGWKELKAELGHMAIVGYPGQALELMKEMAEALEACVVDERENAWPDFDIIDHTGAIAVLKKFKEWK